MTQRFVESEYDRRMLIRFIEAQALPLTVSLTKGGKRSLKQNRLQRQWLNEIADQLGDRTPEEVRAYCKLAFGVAILKRDSEAFRERYNSIIKPLKYEQKMALMMEPFDFAVTRLMNTKQFTAYLDAMHRHFSGQGIVLTDPGDLLAGIERQAA